MRKDEREGGREGQGVMKGGREGRERLERRQRRKRGSRDNEGGGNERREEGDMDQM